MGRIYHQKDCVQLTCANNQVLKDTISRDEWAALFFFFMVGHGRSRVKICRVGRNKAKQHLNFRHKNLLTNRNSSKVCICSLGPVPVLPKPCSFEQYCRAKQVWCFTGWAGRDSLFFSTWRGNNFIRQHPYPQHSNSRQKKMLLSIRDGLTRKNCCSFGFCPNYHPPLLPHPPNLDNLYNFFPTSKFKI